MFCNPDFKLCTFLLSCAQVSPEIVRELDHGRGRGVTAAARAAGAAPMGVQPQVRGGRVGSTEGRGDAGAAGKVEGVEGSGAGWSRCGSKVEKCGGERGCRFLVEPARVKVKRVKGQGT